MDKHWDAAIKFVLNHEGGLSNNPKDPGGITNFGISLRYLKGAGIDIDGDGDSDANDIKAMTKESAAKIYRECWWERYGYGQIDDEKLACKIFDMSVNMGSKQAHKLVQRAINCFIDPPLAVDGIFGRKSFNAIALLIREGMEGQLLHEIRDICAQFYVNLAADKPDLRVFLKGWLRRAAS